MTISGQHLFFFLLAVSAGAAVSVQAVINGSLGAQLNNSMLAATISFGVGFVVALMILIFSGGLTEATTLSLKGISPLLYTGGVLGVLYVTSVLFLVPKIGVGSTIILVIAGQLLVSVLIDHFSLLGVTSRALDGPRILGLLLVVAGAYLVIRKPL
jgi:transporter family-2 protein